MATATAYRTATQRLRNTMLMSAVGLLGLLSWQTNARADVNLADQPLSTSTSVPGNLLLAISAEFPTAISNSYKNGSVYVSATTFIGYFDPNKCYRYRHDLAAPFFQPSGPAVAHACSSSITTQLWSGNWLNWASMQALDTFRSALTGGYRVVDTASQTILEKAWGSKQGSEGSNAPAKRIPASGSASTMVSGATPFNFAAATSRIWGFGNRLVISGGTPTDASTPYTGQNSYASAGVTCTTAEIKKGTCTPVPASAQYADPTATYSVDIKVEVCNSTVGIEANCTKYGSNFKPEGLMQQYSNKIRFGAMAYLNDGNIGRDGGVLRAPMKFVGPAAPVPGQAPAVNGATEWSAVDGTFIVNPDAANASASSVANSGVMNYLNKFGAAAQSYKTYDPVGEMYYAAIRYFKNQGNVASYTSGLTDAYKDGFPVVTNWVDPILYSCQKNFILGIGDTNSHADANLPGSTIKSGNEPATPPEVAADTTVNVKTATDMIGTIEGVANLGSTYPYWCCNQNSYFMGGLAYDSHTKDIRPNDFKNTDGSKSNIQTITTFWLDVLESGYQTRNQYYYAAKYGGFKVPAGFSPYAATNAANTLTVGTTTVPFDDSMWHNTPDMYSTDKRPDNYYGTDSADKMVSGLKSAFSEIASQLAETTTAFSAASPRISNGNASYQSKYEATSWTGDVVGSSVNFDIAGNPTYTKQWSAKTQLDAATPATRKIVTCCTAGNAGLPFEVADLSSGTLNSRTNYLSFAAVANVPATAQSAANFLAYLRGDRTKEIINGGAYRNRTSVLGDIINSKLTSVGPPMPQLTESSNTGYGAYVSSYANRKTVVYVGANDGMMHAFDGSVSLASGGGTELFAYVPSFAYGTAASAPVSGLASLGNPSFVHHNIVDQTPQVFDIDLNKTQGASGTMPKWRSVLIGGLGKGGKGYYAIDVSDPASWTTETAVASKVLWEFTDPSMGYSYGDANVFKTKKYGWVVVFTSGYKNIDGVGYFFIVNPATGALIEKISTGFGSVSNQAGLTYASGYAPSLSDGTADSIYAGDLAGNVWRLDLTGTPTSYLTPTKIAELRDPSGVAQPVTTRPLIEIQPDSQKRYVLIGTGRLLDNTDIVNNQVQSFYSIGDGTVDQFYNSATLPTGASFPLHRSDLNSNANLLSGIGSAPALPLGWYYDFSMTLNGSSERININPTANYGVVAFAANLPNGDACNPSGSNRIFAVNIGLGKSVLTNTVGTTVAYSTKLSGAITDLVFSNVNGSLKFLAGNNVGDVQQINVQPGGVNALKKVNWREVPSAN